jgi:type IV pilus assembly protein PilO
LKLFNLTPKQQIIIFAVIMALVAILLIVLLIVPQVINLGALGVEEQAAKTELNVAKSTYSQLEELKRTSRKTEAELIRVDRKAPEDPELPALLIQIQDISSKSGIGLLSVKPSPLVQNADFAEVPLEIQIDGYFFSLLDFIYRLEKLPRIINVKSIDIKEGTLQLPNISVTVKASAYITTPGVISAAAASTTTPPPAAGGQGTTGQTKTGGGASAQ